MYQGFKSKECDYIFFVLTLGRPINKIVNYILKIYLKYDKFLDHRRTYFTIGLSRVNPGRIVKFFKNFPGTSVIFKKFFTHSYRLGTLFGKNKSCVHDFALLSFAFLVITALPSVSPAV